MLDISTMDSYLESVAGYICDDDKLVTYKWLSKELEVHVNVAKLILWRYWEKHKNEELVATFLIIGNLKDGGMRVEVVKDCDLEKAKEKYEKVTSEHIYSLQKALADVELLAGIGGGDTRFSAITCAKCVILSDEELNALRWGKAQAPPVASTEKKAPVTEKQAPSKKETPVVKETPKRAEETKEPEVKSEEKAKKVSPPSKQKGNEKKGVSKKPVQSTKAGFGHLFGKAGQNQQKPQAAASSSNSASENARKDSGSSPENKASKSSASDLFAKKKAKENEDSSNVPIDSVVSSPEEKHDRTKSGSATSKKPEKPENATNGTKSKTTKSKKQARGTKRGRSQDSEKEAKKRKRIIVASDSSGEESASDQDLFESPPAPPSPAKDLSPSPTPVEQPRNKRKVRKLVDKTYVDEDGYLLTKKEHVYESCSDEEPEVAEPAKKKNVEPVKPKATKSPVKKKQTSLMSFFKKG